MTGSRHLVETLNERMEGLRFALTGHFGGPGEIPQDIKEAYLGTALCAVELLAVHRASNAVFTSRQALS